MDKEIKEIKANDLYIPHANQLRILKDKHRYKVVDAGRRFGKSAMAMNYALSWILSPHKKNQMVWIVLPEYKQAKQIYWIDPDVTKYYLPYVQANLLFKNDSDLYLYNPKNNSYMFLKGSDNPDSLRGSGLDLLIFDEPRDIKVNAFDVLNPTLADSPDHRVIYIGTPNGYDHFHTFLLMGDHEGIIEKGGKNTQPDPEWMTFKFTSYDNLAFIGDLSRQKSFISYIDKQRQYYIDRGQLDFFEQEYMGEIRKKAGAVHKEFSREIHLINPFIVPEQWRRIRGWDFGSTHPTSSIRIAVDNDDNWFIEYCYKEKGKQIDDHIKAIIDQDMDLSATVSGFGDPSGAQWIREFNMTDDIRGEKIPQERRISIRGAKKDPKTKDISWLQLGVDKINAKLHPIEGHIVMLPDGRRIENAPSMFIFNRPENMEMVNEFEGMLYKRTSDGILKAEIDEDKDPMGHYDLDAALRYVVLSESLGISYSFVVGKPVDDKKLMPENKTQAPTIDERTRLERQADLDIIKQQNNARSGW